MEEKSQPVYFEYIFHMLLPISIISLVAAVVGNTFLLRNSNAWYWRKLSVQNCLFFSLCTCNIIFCYVGFPLHIMKLVFDCKSSIDASPYLCMLRYITVISTTNFSLTMLPVLVLSRKEKILQAAPNGGKTIRRANIKFIIMALILLSSIPNAIIFFIYLYLYAQGKSLPCQKTKLKMSIQNILDVLGAVFVVLVAALSIFLLLKSIAQIKSKIKSMPNCSRKTKLCIKKLNISFMYAGIFFIFWIPFGVMSLCSEIISRKFYNVWFNIGYTISFGYVVCLPIVFSFTDKHIQRNLSQNFKRIWWNSKQKYNLPVPEERIPRNEPRKNIYLQKQSRTSSNWIGRGSLLQEISNRKALVSSILVVADFLPRFDTLLSSPE